MSEKLERVFDRLDDKIDRLQSELATERAAHEETKKKLAHVIEDRERLDGLRGQALCELDAVRKKLEEAEAALQYQRDAINSAVASENAALSRLAKKEEELALSRELLNADLKIAGDRTTTLEIENQNLKARLATVRREVLEEAAKVVDDLDMPEMWDGSIGKTDDGSQFRSNAIAAIRALAASEVKE